jgi:hypothetical protein
MDKFPRWTVQSQDCVSWGYSHQRSSQSPKRFYYVKRSRIMAGQQDDSDSEKQEIEESYTPIRRNSTFSYTQTLIVLVLVLQSLLIIRLWATNQASSTSNSQHEDLIERKWHRNTSYMSLDHAYDGLWNETGQSALVFDDERNVVQITMQVFNFVLIRF